MTAPKPKKSAAPPPDEPGRYRFVTGITLTALETQVNLLARHEPLALKQVLFATGTGFVAVMEREDAKPKPG
ncbi:MAG: hypothetical protein JO171_16655 [Paludibacterium sp.]|uniref:hypothetical protein n=1 Tax=Paludibacterium sp. TaxID=1917523 RepID=UPI0025EF4FCF|nr:hypothetical protein [Paludibacterium sp.]MBV8048782.1 hypothetical protein [Paludibacterium sp.]MBV8648833.1 hypothetical protein [Paludibacterium sp.]